MGSRVVEARHLEGERKEEDEDDDHGESAGEVRRGDHVAVTDRREGHDREVERLRGGVGRRRWWHWCGSLAVYREVSVVRAP